MKWIITGVLGILLIAVAVWFPWSGDRQNNMRRTAVKYLDGDYKITHYNCGENVVWNLKGSKVTSDPKGYYFFWVDGQYVQTPINQTIIEEAE